jgi:phenylalanyl-tRNA synthetase beta chain
MRLIFVDNLPNQAKSTLRKTFSTNDFPVVERDFAFLTNKNLAVGDLIKTISNCDKQVIKEVNIFDIYNGKNIAEDKKSVALRIKIQSEEKTLTSVEIDSISKKIIEATSKFYGAQLRQS